mmetsp:Transcript_4835/g.7323  ORF Transcript_4835/g.7323 Transcript_4835/m.7323 type:complete len:269 (-) Transcript_4835:249-1055(-)
MHNKSSSSSTTNSVTSTYIRTQNTDDEDITLSSRTTMETSSSSLEKNDDDDEEEQILLKEDSFQVSDNNEIAKTNTLETLEESTRLQLILLKEKDDLKQWRLNLCYILFVVVGLVVILQSIHLLQNNTNQCIRHEQFHQYPMPHMGRKLQINASAFTANDYECLQLDTGNWPSERVHCELIPGSDLMYYFVVEHFDDADCQQPNQKLPTVRHTSSGCFYYEKYNHSYHDLCHMNRTFTVSAFEGEGCLLPLNVTAVNLLPEDMNVLKN